MFASRDDLVDDIANLFARRINIELGKLGKVDGPNQGAEDCALDFVVGLERRNRPRKAPMVAAASAGPAL